MIPSDEDLEAEMFECTIDMLTAAGLEHYEISNFAKPGKRCRANIIYWENRDYLGVGPSAVSYLDGVRQKNVADVRRYVESTRSDPLAVVVDREELSPLARAGETAIQMLRLTEGIDRIRFKEQTGFDAADLFAPRIRQFAGQGLLESDDRGIRLTRRGMLVANRVMADFLPETAT
jgi:oxygen-independent coproporphyrinogen-3 oxidase